MTHPILTFLLLAVLAPFASAADFHAAAKTQWDAAEGAVIAGTDNILFWAAEYRYLSFPVTHGEAAMKSGKTAKEDLRDPLPAITDFRDKLKAKGIDLVLVPVPPKAHVLHQQARLPAPPATTGHAGMIQALQAAGLSVVDLAPLFTQKGIGTYCKTDTHWSPLACEITASAIAPLLPEDLKGNLATTAKTETITITGDLAEQAPGAKPGPESLPFTRIAGADGNPIADDPSSPIVLLGDSHTLVFHDPTLLASGGGLADHLAHQLKTPIDVRGTRGSGATGVRLNLARHVMLQARKGTDYWADKKVVIWCFTARDFTEASDGWKILPIEK